METEEAPPVAPIQKKAPAKRAPAKKKTSQPIEDIIELDNKDDSDEDFVNEPVKKGGKKAAAAPKPKAVPAAATKRRGPAAAKKPDQLLGQKLLTDMLMPAAESSGISPEKKVRKMRESPFNKKSGSILGRAVGQSLDDSSSSGISPISEAASDEEVVVVAPKNRPQRGNRKQMKYVISDSENDEVGDEVNDDSDFENEDDD